MTNPIGRLYCFMTGDHDATDADVDKLFEHHFARLESRCCRCGAPINISPDLESTEQEYYVEGLR